MNIAARCLDTTRDPLGDPVVVFAIEEMEVAGEDVLGDDDELVGAQARIEVKVLEGLEEALERAAQA